MKEDSGIYAFAIIVFGGKMAPIFFTKSMLKNSLKPKKSISPSKSHRSPKPDTVATTI